MRYCAFLIAIIALFSCNGNKDKTYTAPVEASAGETLFKQNCASCHKPDMDFTGPALSGSTGRWKDKKLLFEFIRNPDKVILKDDYAKALLDKYQAKMTAFPSLTDAEIQSILDYCDAYSKPVATGSN